MSARPTKPFLERIKDMFALHRSEQRGMLVLMGLCLAAAAVVAYMQFVRPAPLADLERLMNAWEPAEPTPASTTAREGGKAAPELFAFDPNGLPVEQWIALGLSQRQAEVLHRYEAKGGRFRSKADLGRMRVVDPELFAAWEPYILLPDERPTKERAAPVRKEREAKAVHEHRIPTPTKPKVEVNTADSAALVALPGIGPAFARGLLRYRELLGGYHHPDQFAEVRVLQDKPEALVRIADMLEVDPTKLRRINVNTATAEMLGRHPYIGWKVAKALVAYRGQHGPFATAEATTGCVLMTPEILEKAGPYLVVE